MNNFPGLYWLPQCENWREEAAALPHREGDSTVWNALVALANNNLDLVSTLRLDRALQTLFGHQPPDNLPTRPVRLAILGSSSLAHLVPGIRVAGLRRNLWVHTYEPAFGQSEQVLSDRQSELYRFKPSAVLLAFDAAHLVRPLQAKASEHDANAAINAVLNEIRRYSRIVQDAFACDVLVQTVLPVFPSLLGSNEHRLPSSKHHAVGWLNGRLRDLSREEGFDLVAVDAWVARNGVRYWHEPVLWHRAKQEISPAASPLYGELVARVLAAQQGRSFKCLVLDLDNTIWGGVVGDDGLSGIVLGQGSALGEAFLSVQAFARDLSHRGVILAVCSKNDEANALEPFDRHPEMLLRRNDISVFSANWNDKAANIRSIATQLNIGLDALVFLDDNPVERDFVRLALPMVAVPEVPSDPALVPQCLSDAGYFEGVSVTVEDMQRTEQYDANRKRAEEASNAQSIETYLSDLNMRLEWGFFDELNLPRIVQLINKTNQFNLTTQRLSEQDVRAFSSRSGGVGLHFRLVDKFGDNGIISVVMGQVDPNGTMILENWLMSCRVIGRQVEHAVLNVIANEARAMEVQRLIGMYRPTPKNGLVARHYETLGFEDAGERSDGTRTWVLDLQHYKPCLAPMQVVGADNE